MITLQITRTENNPDYSGYEQAFNGRYNEDKYLKYEVLTVEITDKQFETIRKSVLEVF